MRKQKAFVGSIQHDQMLLERGPQTNQAYNIRAAQDVQ